MNPSEFYDALPLKACDTCGETMEEMADCYSSTCPKCKGLTFYPLSPVTADLPAPDSDPT